MSAYTIASDWVLEDAPTYDDVVANLQRESADPLPIGWHTSPRDVRWQNDVQACKMDEASH